MSGRPAARGMLAVKAHGPGDLRVERVPLPEPTGEDALVRVVAAGVCATDRKIVSRGPAAGGPLTLGHEIVGVVGASRRVVVAPNVGCGACRSCRRGAPNYCPDHRAFGIHTDGGMAEYLLVPARAVAAGHLLDLPAALGDAEATLVEPLGCCVESLEACRLRPGESVLVVGDGVMGRLHVPLAKVMGARSVALVGHHEARLRHAARLGADVCLSSRSPDYERSLSDAHGGDGFDVIVVTVGSPAAVASGQRHLATGGRLNVFAGLPRGEQAVTVDGNVLHYRNQSVLGTTGASLAALRGAIDLLAGGRLVTAGLVSGRFAIEDAVAAFAAAGEVEHARVALVAP